MNKKSSLLSLFVFVGLLGVAACGQAPAKPTAAPLPNTTPVPTLQPEGSTRTLTVDGIERTYLLHIPPGLDSLHPVPVVFVFHG